MRAFANSFMDLSDSKTETLGQAWKWICKISLSSKLAGETLSLPV